MTEQMKAFLFMISVSEGTHGKGDNGYNVIVGGGLFHSYADHPRILVNLPKLGIKSSAAGRYQILAGVFDAYKKQLNLPDFSPASQDAIAIQLIKECKAVDDIENGFVDSAIAKCRTRWASLPNAGYGQHENKIETLRIAFKNGGGKIA